MGKQKYYVVWKGKNTGIFDSWDECKKQVQGFMGAEYKSFKSRKLAEEAYNGNYRDYSGKDFREITLTPEQLALIGKPKLDSMSVDAACSGAAGPMEYQGVDTKTKTVFFRQGPFPEGTNNIGEFLALVHGIALLKKWDKADWPIYSDSRTAMKWVRDKKCKTTMVENSRNTDLFVLIRRAEKWLRENEYSNPLLKWETKAWGEIPADFGRK